MCSRADADARAALRTGLVPQHPALRAPDVRQALAQQRSLHDSIFSTCSWSTERLGSHPPDTAAFVDAAYQYVAFGSAAEPDRLAISAFSEPSEWLPTLGRVPWARAGMTSRPAWALGGTHFAAAARVSTDARGGVDLVLHILRLSDGAQRAYTLVSLPRQASTWLMPGESVMELAWAPGAPLGRPRLAVISDVLPRQARPSVAWQCSCVHACTSKPCLALRDLAPPPASLDVSSASAPAMLSPVVLPLLAATLFTPFRLQGRQVLCQQPVRAGIGAEHLQPAELHGNALQAVQRCARHAHLRSVGAFAAAPAALSHPRPADVSLQALWYSSFARACNKFLSLLGEAGCEVIYLACEGYFEHSALWSPDGNTLLAHRQEPGRPNSNEIAWLFRGDQAQLHRLTLPFAGRLVGAPVTPFPDEHHRLAPVNMAFSPSSSHLLCLTIQEAAFVEMTSAAVHFQHTLASLVEVWSGVAWGRANYVAAQATVQHAVCIFLASGKPVKLQLLHRMPSCRVVAELSFAGSGLLCSWVEVQTDSRAGSWQPGAGPREVIVQGQARVVCCEVATSRRSVVFAERSTERFTWCPIFPFLQSLAFQAYFEPSPGLSACSMIVRGPKKTDLMSIGPPILCPVVRLRFAA